MFVSLKSDESMSVTQTGISTTSVIFYSNQESENDTITLKPSIAPKPTVIDSNTSLKSHASSISVTHTEILKASVAPSTIPLN